ncbi:MAG: S53 family peptidase [Acidimicrobiales bacterium]
MLAALAVPGAGGASTSSSGLTYQVTPIALPAGHTANGFPYTPSQCVNLFGLACYTPTVLHDAYQVPWSINGQLAGSGTQVAIIDAYGSPTVQQDLNVYDQTFGLPATTVHVYYPEGQVPYSPIAEHSVQASWAEETSLDVQTVHDLAPGATINLIIASSPSGNDINNAIAYAVSNHLGDVLSMSFGAPEAAIAGEGNNLQVQQAHAIFQQATTQGISLFASSGDSGAGNGYTTPNALYPASDPQVVATGGTDLFVSGTKSYTWKSETVWNDANAATCPFGCSYGPFGATGGAPSSIFPAPAWQSSTMRTTSDVAFNASVYTATMIYLGFLGAAYNGFYFFGGTSEAAPSWAAITADLVQAHGSRFGQLAPTLYQIAANRKTYAQDFHDITVGNNAYPPSTGFAAGRGYDLPTGLGTPIVSGLMATLAPSAILGYTAP